MRTCNNVLIFLFIVLLGQSQDLPPEQLGFESLKIESEELGIIQYYLSISKDEKKRPLLVYLDGSGPFPLFQQVAQGIASTVVIDFNSLRDQFSILIISKPGVPFIDEVGSDSNGYPTYDEPSEYTRKLSLEWRVYSADMIINRLIHEKSIDDSKIVVFGYSEGAQVAPFLASQNKHVTHLMLFGGNGLNQFFDPIITARIKAETGQASHEDVQAEIDSLFSKYADIYRDPENTNKRWWGHTYKRWSSFTNTDPLSHLIGLDLPIYMANGSRDQNSVLSADYIKLEFIKRKKTNLYYKTYPNCDHQFNELQFEDGKFVNAVPRISDVIRDSFEWLRKV